MTEMLCTRFAALFMVTPLHHSLCTRPWTDEGEVKEYLGCEVIRDRAARMGKLVQAGYAERVLRTFGMWDCNPVLPLLTLMYA